MKDTFVFYRSWQNVIGELPDATQLEIYRAITEYALNDTTIELSEVAKVAFAFIRQDIDRDTEKYNAICEKNRENAKLGGAPKGNKNAKKQPKTTERLKNNRTEKKQPYNDNDNEDEDDIIKKENGIKEKIPPTPKELEFERFNQWIDENTPYIRKIKNQITLDQYSKLTEKYNGDQIRKILIDISNYKDAPKKYVSVYLTFLKWAKKEYGN